MARVLIVGDCEEKVFSDALEAHGKSNVYWAKDVTVANRKLAKGLGLDRYALVGSDADKESYDEVLGDKPATTNKSNKKAKPKVTLEKEVEAVVDEQSE